MRKLAIDIVLLPSEEIREAALRLNQALLRRFGKKIVLGRNEALPHLSLAMGALKEEALPAAAHLLDEIGSHFPPIDLIFTDIHAGPIATGETVSTLRAERTAPLQSLHETILSRIGPLLGQNAAAEDFVDHPNVQPTSIEWVNRYRTAASFDRFSPHITLGVGEFEPDRSFAQRDTAARLALCHLGNHCTCRKILFETTLRG